jgi:hypothetical protein
MCQYEMGPNFTIALAKKLLEVVGNTAATND